MASASDLETPALRTRNAGVFLIRLPQNTLRQAAFFSGEGTACARDGAACGGKIGPTDKKCGEMFGNISPPC